MAVQATHLNLFPSQLIQDREMINPIGNGAFAYNSFFGIPSAAVLPDNQFLYSPAVCESVQAKTSVNTDSGLTYNISASRKRSRDTFNEIHGLQNFTAPPPQKLPSVAGDDILPRIQLNQFEIDSIISQHSKKMRFELEERRKHHARLLAAAIGEGVMKKLKEKDEQIQRIGKLNLVLQERVKNLFIENQLWRDLAQRNEATANSLRSNLEQVLQNTGGEVHISAAVAAVEDDVESCCSSNGVGDGNSNGNGEGNSCNGERRCRLCNEREPCVLLLPCRHLCLCNVCGSGPQQLRSCPVCNAGMTATLHVNMN